MSKFELFKKLNLMIQASGLIKDKDIGLVLNVERDTPSSAYSSTFSESCSSSDGTAPINVYPNPMAVRFLMGICEEVLGSKVPNRKDDFQMVAITFQLAVSRAKKAIYESAMYLVGESDELLNNDVGGLVSGYSISNEIRTIIDGFNNSYLHTESAVSNALSEPANSTYVKCLQINPLVCLFANKIDDRGLVSFVNQHILGKVPEPALATKPVSGVSVALIDMGIAENVITVGDLPQMGATYLGKSLNVDFEKAFIHWKPDYFTGESPYQLERTWYEKNISSVSGLSHAIHLLHEWDNFVAFEYSKELALKLQLAKNPDTPKMPTRKADALGNRIHDLAEKGEAMRSFLSDVRIRMALIRYGLVVRNPLYHGGDEALRFNPPLILSGFGVVVANYIRKL